MRILFLGDSLAAGYGLARNESLPERLESRLSDRGLSVEVINAGVSGDTTAGGRSRLDWLLEDAPDFVVVELGGNDGLRGIDPAETRRNLDAILTTLGERSVPTLLAGMYAPPNLGEDYGTEFNAIFPDLADKHGVPLYPFILDGVALRPEYQLSDGIHPNAAGADIMAAGLAEALAPILTSLAPGE